MSPERTLIGTAEYATIQTAEGPFLAALVVRYFGSWVLYGLCDDPAVTLNRQPLRPGQRVALTPGALLSIEGEPYSFVTPQDEQEQVPHQEPHAPPFCLIDIQYPDGMEECRAVDHDLLFGRLEFCHVQFTDTRLSRLNALLACDGGEWYIHNLTKKVIGRNRKAVPHSARIANGDELLIGPLVVRVELRYATGENIFTSTHSEQPASATNNQRTVGFPRSTGSSAATDFSDATDDGTGEKPTLLNLDALRANGQRLDSWLKAHPPRPAEPKGAVAAWLEAQRDRLKRFWLDTPETTSARSLRAAGRVDEAFDVLQRAIRARPDSPDLLRELYRLYDALRFYELCYRPLRQIEKLAEMRGTQDTWVLEALARVCEKLGRDNPSMFDRAIAYWTKLETATGASYHHEKKDLMARRALRDGGFAGASEDGA